MFISSVVGGIEGFRSVASEAARDLGNDVVRSEDFPASPSSPREACLAGVRSSDVLVLLVGGRYGERQASGLSATHEEFREATENNVSVLAFVQTGVDREADQSDFLNEVRGWTVGVYTANFRTEEDLRREVTRSLHEWALSQAAGPVDEGEMFDRAQVLVPPPSSQLGYGAPEQLGLVVVGGPRRSILRPAELEAVALARDLQREAQFGDAAVLEAGASTEHRVEGHALLLEQARGSVLLDEEGAVRVAQPLVEAQTMGHLPVLIEEEIRERLERALRFAAWALDHVDSARRLSDVLVLAFLAGAESRGWRTMAEHAREPNRVGVAMGRGDDPIVVQTSPPRRSRAALTSQTQEIAEDLTVLLRREVRG